MLELDLSLDVEPFSGAALLQQLLEVTDEVGIPFPPVPPELVPAFRVLDDLTFGTREPSPPLLNLPAWRDEWLTKPVPDYVVYGVEGGGIVSRVLHYYLVSEPLAVFLQHRLSGHYADQQAGRMRTVLEALPMLLARAREATASGRLAQDQALILVDSDLHESGWARVRHGEPPQWRRDAGWEGLRDALGGA